MTLISALGLGPRAIVALGSEEIEVRKRAVYTTGLRLRDSADTIAAELAGMMATVSDKEHRCELSVPFTADLLKLFTSVKEFHEALYDEYINPARVTIEAELARAGFRSYKVMSIVPDLEKSSFVITLRWVKEPSRIKKMLRPRAH